MASELRQRKKDKEREGHAVVKATSKKPAQAVKRKGLAPGFSASYCAQLMGLAAAGDTSPVLNKKRKSVEVTIENKGLAKETGKEKKKQKKKHESLQDSKPKKTAPMPSRDPEEDQSDDDEADEETQALVRTLDSDVDNEDQGENTFVEGQDVGTIPAITDKVKNGANPSANEEPGVIYIGGLPHGFYEHQLRSYLTQFGPVRNLRISRNPKTGGSRHYGFVEFEEESTAEIVAKTMDAYLLFGNILRCKPVPKSRQHENLFKGANRRFKKVPWAKLEGRKLERPQSEAVWNKRIGKENKRRALRTGKLQALGYEYETPQLKATEGIFGDTAAALENGEETAPEPEKLVEPQKAEAASTAIVEVGDHVELEKSKRKTKVDKVKKSSQTKKKVAKS